MMRSTFAGFTTAQLAMAASQRAIDVTGQNIANINTEGYTRQRLDIASLNLHNGSFYNSSNRIRVGYGVEMTAVSQLRDPFLDAQYRSQIYKLGTTDARAAGLEKLQVPFDETATSGVRDAFLQLSNALQTLSKDDGYTKENDTVVRSRMQIIVNLFREKATTLQDIRTDTENSFKATDIKDLNETLKNLGNLNTTIKNSEILGNPALELKDQRNTLLDELASYLPIDVRYRDEQIGEGYSVQVLDVTFTDTEGNRHYLLSDGRYGQFYADISHGVDGKAPVTLALNDADGNTRTLAKTKQMTAGTNNEYTVYQDKDGNMVYNHGGKYYTDDTGKTEITDDAIIKSLVPKYYYTSESTIGGGTLKGSLDFMNKSGDFDDTDFKGIGYYEKVLDSLVETFVKAFNDANKAVKVDADGKPVEKPGGTPQQATENGYKIYKDKNTGKLVYEKDSKYYETAADTKPLDGVNPGDLDPVMEPEYEYDTNRPLFEKIDPNGGYTADNIKIASGWMDGSYGITNTTTVVNGKVGTSGNESILNMIDMLSRDFEFNVTNTNTGSSDRFFKGSFFSCFANIESTLGIDISSSTVMLDNQITVLNQTSNSRDGISGVQLDEEGMNLLHFNQSYSAAARLMTTLDEMLDKLINGTGVVGR